MGFITIQYIVLKEGLTANLLTDREHNKDIFPVEENGWDIESIHEGIKQNKYYYNIKYPNYPITQLDIEGLSNWAKENNYDTQATQKEKSIIKWDGTKEHLEKRKFTRVILRIKLVKWVESKQQYRGGGLLTEDSPTIPHRSLFYKKIGEEPEKTEWTFPNELFNGNIYTYQRIFKPDYITESIDPELSADP
jgi:hypothetical protein